jgi:hypothetical protein
MVFIVRKPLADIINWTIVIAGTLSGFAHEHTKLFYENFLFLFLFISIVMNSLGFIIHIIGKNFGKKCQENPPK